MPSECKSSGVRARGLLGLIGITTAVTGALLASIRSGSARPGLRLDAPAPPQAASVVGSSGASCPWLSSSTAVGTRVDELLHAMTPLEEATLLHLLKVGTDGIPYQGFTPGMARLCIPMITEQDGAAGVAMGFHDVTQLPAPIADAAAFDPALAGRYGDVIGAEDATKGVDVALAPTINIDRSPQWGRSYESLGEDPFLTGTLAVPLVQSIQSHRVVASVKHLAAYNQETKRGTLQDDSIVSTRALREIYLPAWSAVVQQAHPGSIMCAYDLVNGTPSCESLDLLQQVLHDEWQFNGFVRSDCGSVYHEAAAMAAGVSQVKCSPFYDPATLDDAVRTGRISRATLDALARPLLRVLFRFDLIANPHQADADAVATTPAHQAVALATAEEGTVLLKNTGHLLPLDLAHLSSIALVGANGGTPMPAGYGAVHVQPTHPVNALAALRARLGDRVRYSDGANITDAVQVARHAQVAVVVVSDVEAEDRDRPNLELPGNQDQLVEAVEAANPRTVVVLETGSAVLMPWLAHTPALVETWYPGEVAGTSLVAVLSGEIDPGGKLPVTFPASATPRPADSPDTFGGVGGKTSYAEGIDVGYRWYQAKGTTPAFAFGFGLSYTSFGFSALRATGDSGAGVSVRATVTNTGRVAGSDVVQCYLGAPASTGEPPRQLRGYQRVTLQPGQSTTVLLHLAPGDLAQWSDPQRAWVVAPGAYRLWIGDGSEPSELPLAATVSLAAANLGSNSGPA